MQMGTRTIDKNLARALRFCKRLRALTGKVEHQERGRWTRFLDGLQENRRALVLACVCIVNKNRAKRVHGEKQKQDKTRISAGKDPGSLAFHSTIVVQVGVPTSIHFFLRGVSHAR